MATRTTDVVSYPLGVEAKVTVAEPTGCPRWAMMKLPGWAQATAGKRVETIARVSTASSRTGVGIFLKV